MRKEIILTPDYWDCECENDFIHSKVEAFCKICGCFEDEQPDSRANEVRDWLEKQHENTLFLIEKVDCFGKADVAELLRIEQKIGKLQMLLAK